MKNKPQPRVISPEHIGIFQCPSLILSYFFAPYILEFMKVPQDVWDAALIYTRLVFLGTLGNLGYNMNAGFFFGWR